MKIITWNVNGIRAVQKKGFEDIVKEMNPDLICLQETKACEDQVTMEIEGYEQVWNCAEKKGYSGTAIFTKIKPKNTSFEPKNNEGRVITLDLGEFYLINVYTPNSGRDLKRLEYRKKWDEEFLTYLNNLRKEKPIIVCGDLNVAHTEIDLKNPQANKTTKTKPGNAGYTDQERASFDNIIDSGLIDVYRHFFPDKTGAYTWWSYMFNARKNNAGWRIDYFLCSKRLIEKIKNVKIYSDVMGSDHCPVGIDID